MAKKISKSGSKSKDTCSIMVTIAIILVVLVVVWLIYNYMKNKNIKEKFNSNLACCKNPNQEGCPKDVDCCNEDENGNLDSRCFLTYCCENKNAEGCPPPDVDCCHPGNSFTHMLCERL